MPPEAAKALEDAHKAGVKKAHDKAAHDAAIARGDPMPANHP